MKKRMTIMKYTETNKQAWEHAFDNRKEGFGDKDFAKLENNPLAFLDDTIMGELSKINFKGKSVAHFCCNTGRELLSLMSLGAERGVGFDIAENIIAQARETTTKAEISSCEFVACDILKIPDKYHNQFDVILITIGAICWFEDLTLFFNKVAKCLKPSGIVMLYEIHPFENMLPMPSDDEFDENNLNRFTFSYFRNDPWIENHGMTYMTGLTESKTFTSFSHTMGSIINSMVVNDLYVTSLNEYDEAVSGMTDLYDGKGFPLSFVMTAEKRSK